MAALVGYWLRPSEALNRLEGLSQQALHPVSELYPDLFCAIDDVMIGKAVAVGPNYYARAEPTTYRALPVFGRWRRATTEKFAKERIPAEGILLSGASATLRADGDHRGRDPGYDVSV